jgi:hypothetical protein
VSLLNVSFIPVPFVLLLFVSLLAVWLVQLSVVLLFLKFLSEIVSLILNWLTDPIWTAEAGPMLKILKININIQNFLTIKLIPPRIITFNNYNVKVIIYKVN